MNYSGGKKDTNVTNEVKLIKVRGKDADINGIISQTHIH